MIPIFKDHDTSKMPVAICEITSKGRLRVTFPDGEEISKDDLFDTFGNVGILVTQMIERETHFLIKEFELTHFSIGPKREKPPFRFGHRDSKWPPGL